MRNTTGLITSATNTARLFIAGLVFIFSFAVTFTACDSPPGSAPYEVSPQPFASITLTPNELTFDPQAGIRDTTVTVQITARLRPGYSVQNPVFSVRRQGLSEVFREGTLTQDSGGNLTASFSYSTSTNNSALFTIFVFDSGDNGIISNTLQRNLIQTGFTTQPPEIQSLAHPAVVLIPTEGTTSFRFLARVVHPEGQENIAAVLLELFDSAGNMLGGEPFTMLDDGDEQNSGDEEAGDGVFTRAFSIGPNNQPETYDIRAYALDRQGLSSDTISSTLTIQ